MTWNTKSAPGASPGENLPQKARVTLTDGQVYTLEALRVSDDSLIGFETDADWNGRRIAAPLDQVAKLEVREADAARSIAYTVGLMALFAISNK